jgi:hypothetical protein
MAGRTAPRDLPLKLQALAWIVALRWALATLPFKTVMRLQRRARRVAPPRSPAPHETADRVARAVAAASRRVPGARCLAQALAGQILLARRGVPAEVRLGVARDGTDGPDETRGRGRVHAHAWLESEGRVVLGGADLGRFSALTALTERPAAEYSGTRVARDLRGGGNL